MSAGIVQQTADSDHLLDTAMARAQELAPLGANRGVYGRQKELLFGEDAAINQPHGAAYMLRNLDKYSH